MTKGRLEAFSDGVIAILITIMVLELRVPQGDDLDALRPLLLLLLVLLTYVLSFVFLGIYWNNHHHMLQLTRQINGVVLWANLHLLFWLSLVPFVTGWMGENHFAALPTAIYGGVLLCAALAYTLLQTAIIAAAGAGLTPGRRGGHGLQGQALPRPLPAGHSPGILQPVALRCTLCGGSTDLAHSRPAARAGRAAA